MRIGAAIASAARRRQQFSGSAPVSPDELYYALRCYNGMLTFLIRDAEELIGRGLAKLARSSILAANDAADLTLRKLDALTEVRGG